MRFNRAKMEMLGVVEAADKMKVVGTLGEPVQGNAAPMNWIKSQEGLSAEKLVGRIDYATYYFVNGASTNWRSLHTAN